MRPVNLIPAEERHGQHSPLRSGPLPYILVGALVAALVAVGALVVLDNQISDRKSEVAQLKREDAAEAARALRLSSYTQLRELREQRVATVSSLANSRFDWERVMRELALILPDNVWLVSLDASASASAGTGGSSGSGGSSLTGSIAGPSLALAGCATSQDAVAGFVTALKDIDGVTRVAVESSELASQKDGAGSTAGSGGSDSGSSDCRTREFIAKFGIVVAFDAAPVPSSTSDESAPISATEKSEAAAEETSGEGSEGG
jgi:Tfp pilus assembly protein PilN